MKMQTCYHFNFSRFLHRLKTNCNARSYGLQKTHFPTPSRFGRANDIVTIEFVSPIFPRIFSTLNCRYLTAGMFECHDKTRFDVTALSPAPMTIRIYGQRLKLSFERFVDAKTQSDETACAADKRIGNRYFGRLKRLYPRRANYVFAHRPAPIQINYLGYPGRWVQSILIISLLMKL